MVKDPRAKKLAKHLWEACCLSGSFPPPFPHFSAAEAVLEGVYSGWQAVEGDWPQITQHENSVHKISSRVLCIRRQGKMSHSAELRGERWNRKNWNRTSYPPPLLSVSQRTELRVSQPDSMEQNCSDSKYILLYFVVVRMFFSCFLLHLLFSFVSFHKEIPLHSWRRAIDIWFSAFLSTLLWSDS